MVAQKVIIQNTTGLHLRPAGFFCKKAMEYKSTVTFRIKDTTGNAKSLLSVLGACIKHGDEIEIMCDGEDQEEALEAMVKIVEEGLGE